MGSSRKGRRKRAKDQVLARQTAAQTRANSAINAIATDTVTLTPSAIVTTSHAQAVAYSGPFPSPDMLAGYEIACPGSARTLLELYRDQVRHRMKLEDRVTKGDNIRAYLGWASATVISLFLIGLGGYLIYLNHDAAGASIIATNLVAIAGVFLYGTESRRREREAKARIRDASRTNAGHEEIGSRKAEVRIMPQSQQGDGSSTPPEKAIEGNDPPALSEPAESETSSDTQANS